jgi:hypothetical protein
VRGAHPDDVTDRTAEAPEPEKAVASLSPFELDPYYEDAFCVLLDGGMRSCCG